MNVWFIQGISNLPRIECIDFFRQHEELIMSKSKAVKTPVKGNTTVQVVQKPKQDKEKQRANVDTMKTYLYQVLSEAKFLTHKLNSGQDRDKAWDVFTKAMDKIISEDPWKQYDGLRHEVVSSYQSLCEYKDVGGQRVEGYLMNIVEYYYHFGVAENAAMKDTVLYAAYILHNRNVVGSGLYHAAVDLMDTYVDYVDRGSLNASK